MSTHDFTKDLIEQFADGEPVSPEALVTALATIEGREHLRGVLALRALMADTPVAGLIPQVVAAAPSLSASRVAAAAILAIAAAAGGYVAGTRQTADVAAISPAPAPTTVIKLDASQGWRDQSGGF